MESSGAFGLELVVTIAALVLVLVLAWFAIRTLARVAGTHGAGARVRLMQSASVGARERVILVRYDDHEYLLGVSPGGISLLDRTAARPDSHTDAPT